MEGSLCGRVACADTAVAVLLMSPQQTRAWLVAPDHAFAPEGVPLCASHADRISVPFGWTLTDERVAPRKKRRRKKAAPEPEPQLLDGAPEAALANAAPPEDAAPAGSAPTPAATPPEPDHRRDRQHVARSTAAEPETDDAVSDPSAGSGDFADERGAETSAVDPDLVDPDYVPPEYQFREDEPDIADTALLDEPTIEMPAIGHEPATPAEVPVDADRVAAAVEEESPRLSVVPGDDDPDKTYGFSEAGQGALWNEPEPAEIDPDESTPLLKRAFRVVRDD